MGCARDTVVPGEPGVVGNYKRPSRLFVPPLKIMDAYNYRLRFSRRLFLIRDAFALPDKASKGLPSSFYSIREKKRKSILAQWLYRAGKHEFFLYLVSSLFLSFLISQWIKGMIMTGEIKKERNKAQIGHKIEEERFPSIE